MTESVTSLPLGVTSLSKVSTEPLQNFDRTSEAILVAIGQSPALKQIAAAWPTLPPPIRTAIMTLIDSSAKNQDDEEGLLAIA